MSATKTKKTKGDLLKELKQLKQFREITYQAYYLSTIFLKEWEDSGVILEEVAKFPEGHSYYCKYWIENKDESYLHNMFLKDLADIDVLIKDHREEMKVLV